MPVSNYAQAVKFSAMCGTALPDWLNLTYAIAHLLGVKPKVA
jgi:5,10-methylenetetrahydrofolate reductase